MADLIKKHFYKITLTIPEEFQEMSSALLSDFPFTGIEDEFDEQSFTIEDVYWDNGNIANQLLSILESTSIPVEIKDIMIIEDQNWNAIWEESLEPVQVNESIVITPIWKAHQIESPIKIIINPQMSFGTGYHATTRMVCRKLQEYVDANTHWIDAGCGSGVLAILAEKLGASYIYAFDNDEWSIANTKENIPLNNCTSITVEQVSIFNVDLPQVHGIAANLYRNLLIPNIHKFAKALEDSKGVLIMSGILRFDEQEIIDCAVQHNFIHISTEYEGDWTAITMRYNA
jgi:ribosomal protein L11 methyltransferase